MNNSVGILGIVLIILGAVSLLAGLLCRNYGNRRERYRGRAEATVVDIVADEPDARGKEMGIHDYFYPVFAFYANGRLIRERFPQGSNPCEFILNQKVKIQYKLSEPSVFRLKQKNSMERTAKLLHVVGMLLILAGGALFLLFANRKWL